MLECVFFAGRGWRVVVVIPWRRIILIPFVRVAGQGSAGNDERKRERFEKQTGRRGCARIDEWWKKTDMKVLWR